MTTPVVSRRHPTIVEDAATLLRELPIEPGHVRSKRLLKHDEVTVLGVAIDAGAEMREHVAAVPILIQLVSGEAVLHVEGKRVALLEGTVVHVDAHAPTPSRHSRRPAFCSRSWAGSRCVGELNRRRLVEQVEHDVGGEPALNVHLVVRSYCVFQVADQYAFGDLFDRDLLAPERRDHLRGIVGDVVVA